MKKLFFIPVLLSALFMVIRGHYYTNALTLGVFFICSAPALYMGANFLLHFLYKQPYSRTLMQLGARLSIGMALLAIVCSLFEANNLYCSYMIKKQPVALTAQIENVKQRRSNKRGVYKTIWYSYMYSGKKYSSKTNAADNNSMHIGDSINIKISTIDPTVSELVE